MAGIRGIRPGGRLIRPKGPLGKIGMYSLFTMQRLGFLPSGTFPQLIYGNDPFVVGADVVLHLYNPLWTDDSVASTELTVYDATDDVRKPPALSGNAIAKYNGAISLDHRIVTDIFSGATTCFPALWIRKAVAQKQHGYLVQWDSGGDIILYQVEPDGNFGTVLGHFGAVAINTLYPNAFAEATGVGASVAIRFGDDVNGSFLFNDASAGRQLTGSVGFEVFDAGLTQSCSFKNMRIYNLS